MFKRVLEKAEEPEIKRASIHWITQKAKEFQKIICFCFIDYAKAFDCVDHNKVWKILQEMGIPDHLTCLLRNLYAGQEATVRTWHGKTNWFQTGKGVCQGCHPVYLNYMQSTLCKMLGWMNHKLELSSQEKYQWLQIHRWHHSKGKTARGTKEPLDEGERGEWKSWLKTQY